MKESLENGEKQLNRAVSGISKALYTLFYATGIGLSRLWKRFYRRLKPLCANTAVLLGRGLLAGARWVGSLGARLYGGVRIRGQRLQSGFNRGMGHLRRQDWAAVRHSVRGGFSGAVRAVPKVLNYVMPVLALVLFWNVYQAFSGKTLALNVEYDGQNIGYVADESVFEQAQQEVRGRILYENYEMPQDYLPKYTLSFVDETELVGTDTLTDRIILASDNELTESNGLYVDGDFIGAVPDEKSLIQMLDGILEEHRQDGAEGEDEQAVFTNRIQIKEGLYPVTSVVDASIVREKVTSDSVQTEQTYTVQPDDTPLEIASLNHVSYSDLKALNPDIEETLLVGQEVIIAKAQPKLGVAVTKTVEYTESIPYESEVVESDSKYKSYREVTTQGREGEQRITAQVTYTNGVETSRVVLDTSVISEPVNEVITQGTKTYTAPSYSSGSSSAGSSGSSSSSSGSAGSGFIWPVAGGYVSCGFLGYSGHTGMDIAAPSGTPIYASKSGTVTVAVNRGAYGKHIIISHGGGVTTLYAHCSALAVSSGQTVSQGQLIGYVGETGNAYGNHCHFEIRVNGSYQNPASYVSN